MNLIFKRSAPFLALLGLALGGCQPDLNDDPKSSAGQADFSRYVSVGNSLTAGISDGGLYREGQLNSYPNILAQQFKQVGGGEFVQPLFSEAQLNGSGYLRLAGFTATGGPITANVTTNLGVRGAVPTRTNPLPRPQPIYTKDLNVINNLGVSGIRMSDITTAGLGNVSQTGGTATAPTTIFNEYFERITPDGSNETYLERVRRTVDTVKPTFFTSWLGNNDVLGFATAGGAGSSLTPIATFTANNNQVLDALTAGGAKGVVATIPDVTTIPFFTTVGPSFKATLAANNVPGIVTMTGAAPGGPASGNRRQIATVDIRDAAGAGRQLFTLTSAPFLGLLGRPTGAPWRSFVPRANLAGYLTAYGVDTLQAFGATAGNPIPSAFILDDTEQAQVQTAITAFNAALVSAANTRNLAIFDVNTFFRSIATNGLVANTTTNTAAYISGNIFSLDGVHPTPRGYALIANEIIKVINAKYGSSLPGVDASAYRGVLFPQ
ncbi:SGNH/GDSL hydrolase family protein [Hymenobacter sp. B1770]|uniref:SGNH/GDSL hydrolase family protein n=1 Tax=Hymenobacter sp. B1770 TaxID=1718788 RepID=UPI003CE7F40F